MESIYDVIDQINDKMRERLKEMFYCMPEELGLDNRAGYRLWCDRDSIIVDKQHDRSLQYYGGFEYCDKDYRHELGDYVIYTADDDRVEEHIAEFYNNQDESQRSEET